jgi:hypothetical protein
MIRLGYARCAGHAGESFAWIKKEIPMKLSQPKFAVWLIALILGIAGLLGFLVTIPVLTSLAFWLVLIGLALLLLATAVKGL